MGMLGIGMLGPIGIDSPYPIGPGPIGPIGPIEPIGPGPIGPGPIGPIGMDSPKPGVPIIALR
jgi:hypothetical protein